LFQSTRPRGARLITAKILSQKKCFNPRAHAGRDKADTLQKLVINVSIHAPTRGATSELLLFGFGQKFQSTRPRGARHGGRCTACTKKMFQSTRPRGARLCDINYRVASVLFQSTRPRGARQAAQRHSTAAQNRFNPRAHAGRDDAARSIGSALHSFQSTRPRGARLLPCNFWKFNSFFAVFCEPHFQTDII